MTIQRTTTKAALRMASSFLPELLEEHLDPAVAASVAKSLIRKAPYIQYLPQKDEIVLHLSLDSAGEVDAPTEIPGQTAIDDGVTDMPIVDDDPASPDDLRSGDLG